MNFQIGFADMLTKLTHLTRLRHGVPLIANPPCRQNKGILFVRQLAMEVSRRTVYDGLAALSIKSFVFKKTGSSFLSALLKWPLHCFHTVDDAVIESIDADVRSHR